MMDVQKPVALDQTTSTILAPDGTPAQKPCTLLSLDECSVIRDYHQLLKSLGLQAELFCRTCYDGRRESQSAVNITSADVHIICGCRLLYGRGAARAVMTTRAVGPEDRLADWAGRLFLSYMRVLRKYYLLEALRCLTCWELSVHDGCRARVVNHHVDVECRHRHLTYHEVT